MARAQVGVLALLLLAAIGCGSSDAGTANQQTASGQAAPAAPVATQAAGGGGGGPTAVQGGHFANPNATVAQPGSKLGGN